MSKNQRHHFLVVFLTACAGLLIALSLIPTGLKPNLLGNFGSNFIAYPLYKGFGCWAWIFPVVFIRFAIGRYRDEELIEPGLKLLGLILALVSLCAMTRVLFPGYQMFSASQMREEMEWGGWVGVQVGDRMEAVLTRFGTTVIGLMVLVFSAWLMEKEEHLVKALKGILEGFQKAGEWFKENGFQVFALLYEKAGKSFGDWKVRRHEKKIAAEARQKLESEQKAFQTTREDRPQRPESAKPINNSKPSVSTFKPEKVSKASSKAKPFFTGEAEPFDSADVPLGTDSLESSEVQPVEGEEDLVSAALAEAKGPEVMTRKQKMEAASIEMAEEDGEEEEPAKPARVIRQWQLPTVHILKTTEEPKDKVGTDFEGVSRTLKETLNSFGVEAYVVGVNPGPTVTQYEVQPAAGVKITRIASLADDLALALKCGQVRVVAPIPGKATVGVEVPNIKGRVVTLKELLSQESFMASGKKLLVVLGKDISGEGNFASIKEMPHVLIAGSTGSGKSVCVNSLIASLIFKYTPEDLRLVLIDPKRVEMSIYKGLPHLALPVVNDPKEAHFALKWLVREMEERYEMLAHIGARDIDTFNAKIVQKREAGETNQYPMYYIVVLVDELADLMMVAKDQVEDSITRLAQMARAVGIHLVLATQRPSVEVITGIIKANFPARIAFQVFSKVDSRTILDMNGAEALVGRGDMLYLPSGAPKPLRLQGAYVTLEEIERLVDFWKSQGGPQYSADLTATKSKDIVTEESQDELYDDAVEIVIRAKQASTSLLQRRLKVGYSRAARLLDDMEMRGVVGPADGNKPRKILAPGVGGSNDSFEEDEEVLDEKMD
jgi:DNA segregation ATPase FtsK/SpoIIIE-like protein